MWNSDYFCETTRRIRGDNFRCHVPSAPATPRLSRISRKPRERPPSPAPRREAADVPRRRVSKGGEKTHIHTYIERLTKRDRVPPPYRTLSGPCRNTSERFRPSCSFPRSLRPRRAPVTRSNPVLLALLSAIRPAPPVVLVAHLPPLPCHTFYHSLFSLLSRSSIPPMHLSPFRSDSCRARPVLFPRAAPGLTLPSTHPLSLAPERRAWRV